MHIMHIDQGARLAGMTKTAGESQRSYYNDNDNTNLLLVMLSL